MIRYIKATDKDIETLMQIRLEMLREVNDLQDDFVYDDSLVEESKKYFEVGDQTTVLAFDGEKVVGCASISYIYVMPTFSHPTGKRAHLMNVYTNKEHRRKGVSKNMLQLLIDEAKEKGVTEISLDATEKGKPLYYAMGFVDSDSCMVMNL